MPSISRRRLLRMDSTQVSLKSDDVYSLSSVLSSRSRPWMKTFTLPKRFWMRALSVQYDLKTVKKVARSLR